VTARIFSCSFLTENPTSVEMETKRDTVRIPLSLFLVMVQNSSVLT